MNHLTDGQLVEILYSDFDLATDGTKAIEHLQECGACRERLEALRVVAAQLDSSQVPTGPPTLDVRSVIGKPLTRRAVQTNQPASPIAVPSWPGIAVAASLLMLVASAGFVAGTVYQSRHWASEIQGLVVEQVDHRIRQFSVSPSPDGNSLESLVSDLVANQLDNQDRVLAARIDGPLRQLASEQSRLRQDLESLAVNAEKELLLTNRELRAATDVLGRLQEFANSSF